MPESHRVLLRHADVTHKLPMVRGGACGRCLHVSTGWDMEVVVGEGARVGKSKGRIRRLPGLVWTNKEAAPVPALWDERGPTNAPAGTAPGRGPARAPGSLRPLAAAMIAESSAPAPSPS